jgi:hypothetical protein
MPRYQIVTLVDITRTGATKTNGTEIQVKQQSNFNSLRQAIEMRSNVSWLRDPKKQDGQLPHNLAGKATYWTWEFDVEREDVFLVNDSPTGLLLDDLNGVPIISDLENSVEISPSAIQTFGKNTNTWVYIL